MGRILPILLFLYMKISILGNIIETEYIYQITNLNTDFYEAIFSKKKKIISIDFEILFFNQKKMRIYIAAYQFDEEGNYKASSSHAIHSDEVSEKIQQKMPVMIESIRNEILKFWNPEDSKIPKIEYE